MTGLAMRQIVIDARQLRIAGVLMMAGGLIIPLFAGTFPEVWCPLRAATGVPCCLCGMTTSVTAVMHGDLGAALAANPFGIVAVAAAIGLLVARRVSSVRLPVAVLVLGAAVSWMWQLARYGFV